MAHSLRFLSFSLVFTVLFGLVAGCSKTSESEAPQTAVKIEDLNFDKSPPRKPVWKWVQREEQTREIPETPEQMPKTEILYGKIQMNTIKATTNEYGLVVTTDFYFENEKITSEIQFTTVETEGYKAFLETSDEKLKDVLKASVTCLEDIEPGTACREFFIDVYFKKDGKLYSDQFVVDQESEAALEDEKEKVKEEESTEDEAEEGDEEEEHDHAEMIEDDGAVIEQGAYVGTPLLDVFKLFYEKKEAKSPPTTMTTTTTSTTTTSTTLPKTRTPVPPKAPSVSTTTTLPPTTSTTRPPTSTSTTTTTTTTSTTLPKAPVRPEPPKVRVMDNQSIGLPSRGSISNATDFFEYSQAPGARFKMLLPSRKKYYGSFNLLRVVNDYAKFVQTLIPDYLTAIKDVSKKNGGKFGHKSHQNGLDADIRYITKSDSPHLINVVHAGKVTEDFQVAPQWQAFKHLVSTNNVVMIYVDKVVRAALCEHFKSLPDAKVPEKVEEAKRVFKYLDPNSGGHHNHFHLRVKCGDNQPRCRVQIYTRENKCV